MDSCKNNQELIELISEWEPILSKLRDILTEETVKIGQLSRFWGI